MTVDYLDQSNIDDNQCKKRSSPGKQPNEEETEYQCSLLQSKRINKFNSKQNIISPIGQDSSYAKSMKKQRSDDVSTGATYHAMNVEQHKQSQF